METWYFSDPIKYSLPTYNTKPLKYYDCSELPLRKLKRKRRSSFKITNSKFSHSDNIHTNY